MATIQVLGARNLNSTDLNPYCIIGITQNNGDDQFLDTICCVTSEIKWRTLQPKWKTAVLKLETIPLGSKVRVEIWDKDKGKKDSLVGYVIVSLDYILQKGLKSTGWFSLISTKKSSGDIHLKFHFNENSKATQATIFQVEKFLLSNWGVVMPQSLTPTALPTSLSPTLSTIKLDSNSSPPSLPVVTPSSPPSPLPVVTPSSSFLMEHIKQSAEKCKQQRMVRIFLSSTFVDMHDEREEMMRNLMVQLNSFCYDRGLALTYIDMRWGITKEMTEQTILRCLQEVDNARPYFIGLLAQRYGWHQETDGADPLLSQAFELAEKEPQTRSVTELEMLHGVLLNGYQSSDHSFFLFRDESCLTQVDEDTRQKWEDSSEHAKQRMSELKTAINEKSKQGLCHVSNYNDPKQLTSILLPLLKASIEKDFPIVEMTEDQKQEEEHINVARHKCVVYVPDYQIVQQLKSFVSSNDAQEENVMAISGPSGSGKSSLIAHWWLSIKDSFSIPVFVHFIGSSLFASDFSCMILRLFKQVNSIVVAHGGSELSLPKTEDAITENISVFFQAVSKFTGMIIVFDAVNQLPTKFREMHWLPSSIPSNVRILTTTVEVSEHFLAHKSKPKQIEMRPMQENDKRKLIEAKLTAFGKTITSRNIDRLCAHPCSSNPLFLQTVLGELCIVGYHRALESQLGSFLDCDDLPSLFIFVIERLEKNFGDLARDVLLLIACSRFGIKESSLSEIFPEVSPLELFPLISAMKKLIVVHHNKMRFAHQYLENAVISNWRYSISEFYYTTRSKLVEYLIHQPFDRSIAFELPWLLSQIIQASPSTTRREQELLSSTLATVEHFDIFFSTIILECETAKYHNSLQAIDSQWNKAKIYLEKSTQLMDTFATTPINKVKSSIETLMTVSQFLAGSGHLIEARQIGRALVDVSKHHFGAHHELVSRVLLSFGSILELQGHLSEAIAYYEQSLSLSLRLSGELNTNVAKTLELIGEILDQQGKAGALECKKRSLNIRLQLFGENHLETASSLNSIGNTLRLNNQLDEAMDYYKRSLIIHFHLLGETHPYTLMVLNNVGATLKQQGHLDEALEYHKRSLAGRIELYGENHPSTATALNCMGTTLKSRGQLDEALDYYKRSLQVRVVLYGEYHPKPARALFNIGNILKSQGKLEEALAHFNRALIIYSSTYGSEHNDTHKIQRAVSDLHKIYHIQRKSEKSNFRNVTN